jgi:hypothetical protein
MHGICAYPRAEACRRVAHFVPWRAAVKEQFGRLPVGPAKAPSARLCEIGNGQLRYAAPRLGAQDPVFVFEDHVGQKLWSLEKLRPFAFGEGFQLERVLFSSWRPRGSDSSLQSFGTWFTER